jgi:hypothetical protein
LFLNFNVEQLEVSSSFSQYLYIKNQSSGFSYFSIILCSSWFLEVFVWRILCWGFKFQQSCTV